MLDCFGHTCIGFSHLAAGKPCQDAALTRSEGETALIAVSDGHGNIHHLRSQFGAQLACEIALDALNTWLKGADLREALAQDADACFARLEEGIVAAWYDAVLTHARENPFSEEELDSLRAEGLERYAEDYADFANVERAYGCTLIAAAVTKDFWTAVQIGDGELAWTAGDGAFSFTLAEAAPPVGELTHSLCEENATAYFRHAWGETCPSAMFAYTDGIQKAYAAQSLELTQMLTWLGNIRNAQEDRGAGKIAEFFRSLTKQSSAQDDVGISCILTQPHLPAPKRSAEQLRRLTEACEARLAEIDRIIAYNEGALARMETALLTANDALPQEKRDRMAADIRQIKSILARKAQERKAEQESLDALLPQEVTKITASVQKGQRLVAGRKLRLLIRPMHMPPAKDER